jgi:hypothetical protein
VEKLPQKDYEGKYNNKGQDEYRGGEQLFLFEGPNKSLKREVIYF